MKQIFLITITMHIWCDFNAGLHFCCKVEIRHLHCIRTVNDFSRKWLLDVRVFQILRKTKACKLELLYLAHKMLFSLLAHFCFFTVLPSTPAKWLLLSHSFDEGPSLLCPFKALFTCLSCILICTKDPKHFSFYCHEKSRDTTTILWRSVGQMIRAVQSGWRFSYLESLQLKFLLFLYFFYTWMYI